MNKILFIGLIAVSLLSTATLASARFTISPSIAVKGIYDDNLFLSPTDEEDDFITTISPKVVLDYKTGKSLDINLDYGFDFKFYSDNSDFNETSIKETQRAKLVAQVRPVNRVFVDIFDIYQKTPVDIKRGFVEESSVTNMTVSNVFTLSPRLELPITPSLDSTFGYRFTNAWYDADEGNKSDGHTFYATMTKRLPSRFSLSLNYDYLIYRPDLTPKYDKQHVAVRIDYQMKSNLKFWGEIGKDYVDFKNAGKDNTEVWGVGSEYISDFMEGLKLTVTYSKSLSESLISVTESIDADEIRYYDINTLQFTRISDRGSITSGLSELKKLNIILEAGTKLLLAVNPYYSIRDEMTTSREDKVTGVEINITYPLATRSIISLNGLLEKEEFEPDNENVDRYGLGGEFSYNVNRYLTANLGYKYFERDSNLDADDFTNNLIWLQAILTF